MGHVESGTITNIYDTIIVIKVRSIVQAHMLCHNKYKIEYHRSRVLEMQPVIKPPFARFWAALTRLDCTWWARVIDVGRVIVFAPFPYHFDDRKIENTGESLEMILCLCVFRYNAIVYGAKIYKEH